MKKCVDAYGKKMFGFAKFFEFFHLVYAPCRITAPPSQLGYRFTPLAELLSPCFWHPVPPPLVLSLHPDIALLPQPKYQNLGSHKGLHFNGSHSINSFWSTTRRHPRYSRWTIVHSALSYPTRKAKTPDRQHVLILNFVQLNILSLLNKSCQVHDLLLITISNF